LRLRPTGLNWKSKAGGRVPSVSNKFKGTVTHGTGGVFFLASSGLSSAGGPVITRGMRGIGIVLLLGGVFFGMPSPAATGRVLKVLPHYLDASGKHTVSPSLYDRDAYQYQLREQPQRRGGMRFDIHWKTKGAAYAPLRLILELRGVAQGSLPKQLVLASPAEGGRGWFGRWTPITLTAAEYKHIGEVTAWRVTLWEGNELLSEQKSFLW